jgi:hypothetical protein
MASDYYATPESLSWKLISASVQSRPRVVADFSAGEGHLLAVAEKKWGTRIKLIANDIDYGFATKLRRRKPHWIVSSTDFLAVHKGVCARNLREYQGLVDIVILNPPFTYQGKHCCTTDLCGVEVTCSPAMAFVANSIRYLRPKGEILVVLPSGALNSSRDQACLNEIKRDFHVRVLAKNARNSFPNCFPSTALVKIVRKPKQGRKPVHASTKSASLRVGPNVFIRRGSIQMHNVPDDTAANCVPLVHSTELQDGDVRLDARMVRSNRSLISGPAVIIPRVGRPSRQKICIMSTKQRVALSDCVIALKFQNIRQAKDAKSLLLDRWRKFSECYTGTGAPYITVDRLSEFVFSAKE